MFNAGKRLLRGFAAAMALMLSLGTPLTAEAAARQVDYKNYQVQYYNSSSPARLARKLGLKKKSSRKFKKYYKGKKVVVGWNSGSASYPKKYVYIKNSGNKKFTVYGVKIGDSKKTVKKKMNKVSWLYSSGSRTLQYGPDYDGYTFKFNRKGKLISWTYQIYPTS